MGSFNAKLSLALTFSLQTKSWRSSSTRRHSLNIFQRMEKRCTSLLIILALISTRPIVSSKCWSMQIHSLDAMDVKRPGSILTLSSFGIYIFETGLIRKNVSKYQKAMTYSQRPLTLEASKLVSLLGSRTMQ